MSPAQETAATVAWQQDGQPHHARWRSEAGVPPPARIMVVDDSLKADAAYRLACEGTALLWRGDFHNARQLLQAIGRRLQRKPAGKQSSLTAAFHQHRQRQAQRAAILNKLLVPLAADYSVPLRRAPDLRAACEEAYGVTDGHASLVALRELLGLVGAHEWRKKGVPIPALGDRIHPHYGVFSPVRGEYIDLVATAPLPATDLAFDIGTGTGVLAALLARRGVRRIVATDQDPRALACASENLHRLRVQDQVEVIRADLFPPGRASLVVCNPPWLPGKPSAPIEQAVYDPDSRMLLGFLNGLRDHLTADGEGWLILSDLAELLGLRSPEFLAEAIANAGLRVFDRLDIAPRHPKATDPDDPLHAARKAERTVLWRLAAA